MDPMTIITWIIVGAVAGWLADAVVGGIRGGLVATVVTGIVGAFIGGWLLPKAGVAIATGTPIVDAIIVAFIGAVVLLVVLKLIR